MPPTPQPPALCCFPRRDARRTGVIALTLLAGALCFTGGCSRSGNISLPPGLAQDEARRITQAVELASDAYRTKEPEAAFGKYRRAVETYRELPSAWNNLGVLLMQQERYLEAAEAFRAAGDLAPTDPRPLYNLGLLWDRRGYIREARALYAEALERDPGYLPALRGGIRADSLLSEGTTQTLGWLERALLSERDEVWRTWMRLQKARIEALPDVRLQNPYSG